MGRSTIGTIRNNSSWPIGDRLSTRGQMLPQLRLAHRLLLIYLLSFVSVAVLAYSLVVEKNIAIDFAQKERRGAVYVAVVRDALFAIIKDRLADTASETEGPSGGSLSL